MSKSLSKSGRLIDKAIKTPRTNVHTIGASVDVIFARQLETELIEARAEIEYKNALIEQLCKGLEAVIRVADRDTDEFTMAKAALSAAKRM